MFFQQARLSPVVEADPDVAAAMDILSFALYHENNEVVDEAQNELSRKRHREEPITDSSDTEEGESSEKDPKRQAAAPEASRSDESLMEIKRAIYDQLSKGADDGVSLEEVCPNIADRDSVLQALQSLEADGKVMLDDENNVYLTD
jgi:hypothetical protein